MNHLLPHRQLDIYVANSRENDTVLTNIFRDVLTQNKRIGMINLNDVVYEAAILKELDDWSSPPVTQDIVHKFTAKHDLAYSYGGWLEDRSFLWEKTYMHKTNKFVHLGVDVNVPAGSIVHSPIQGKIINVEQDFGEDVDWGTSLALESKGMVFIYAHLAEQLSVKIGDTIRSGQVLGRVGTWPRNGNVFEHLHIQAMLPCHYEQHRQEGFEYLDGYGVLGDEKRLEELFPQPLYELHKRMPK